MDTLVTLSGPRVGSHMVRSMLASERTRDLGAYLYRTEAPQEALADLAALAGYVADARDDGRLLLAGLTGGHYRRQIEQWDALGARWLLLRRRDKLAQVASIALAIKYDCARTAAPAGASVTMTPEWALGQAEVIAHNDAEDARAVRGPRAVLYYEEITVKALQRAVDMLRLPLVAHQPDTVKSAPPLGDYLTNLDELRPLFRERGLC